MALTLRNQRNPRQTLSLTHTAWYGILDLADLYGWSPLSAQYAPGWQDLEIPLDGYDVALPLLDFDVDVFDASQLIILEDALNLADALEQAFFEYEPTRVPAWFYLFEPDDQALRQRPGIGALTAVIDFCRQGPFWVEPYRRPD